MSNDLLIGGIDNYGWDDIAPWIVSAKASGFTGDIILVCYRIAPDVIARIEAAGVHTYQVQHTPFLTAIDHSANGPTQAHNLRFYHMWEVLTQCAQGEYRYVITTDVRDVIFQYNPVSWLTGNLMDYEGVASGEGIVYEKEDWGMDNMRRGYGDVVWDLTMHNQPIYNVGVLAGRFEFIKHTLQLIYEMTVGRHYPSDQSSWNILVNGIFTNRLVFEETGESSWAAQLGTTHDPTKSHLWNRLHTSRNIIDADGTLRTVAGDLVAIVHQWDRVPQLRQQYKEKYCG